jgi:DNA polymerase I-like protein with 3'-5' exonuclease and polymerase domains
MDKLPQEAIEACRPRLLEELKEVAPETVIAMGNSAVSGVTSEKAPKVTKLRIGPPREGPGYRVMATFHPAACLRTHDNFPHMVRDIGKAIAIDPPTLWYEPEIVIVTADTFNETVSHITALNRGQGIIVDTESGRDKDSAYGNIQLENLLCVGVGPLDPTNQDRVFVFPDHVFSLGYHRKEFAKMLNACGMIPHYGKYDCEVLEQALEYEITMVFDTLLGHYVTDERTAIHSLDYLAREYLGAPDWKAALKPYISNGDYATIPRDVLYTYNGWDVHATRLLYSFLSDQVEAEGLTTILNHLMRSSRTLQLMERKGLGFDLEYSEKLEAGLLEEQQRLEESIPFNPRSWQQVLAYFEKTYNIILPNTEEKTLEIVTTKLPQSHPAQETIKQILAARGYTKMLGTYVTGLQEKITDGGTVHPSFLLHTTTTGRLSSRNPNAQNIPRGKELKRQFIPSCTGNLFIQCDYSQAELRVVTYLARDEGMRALFNDPTRDVFIELARNLFSNFDSLSPSAQKELRVLVKKFAYGILYGRGAAAIAKEQGIPIAVAQKHHKTFLSGVPDIVAYQRSIIKKVHSGEDLINPFGRHRRFYLITPQNRSSVENEARSFMPQSTASDICLESANRLTAQGVDIRNIVHDAILAEAGPHEASEISQLMQETMAQVGKEITDGYVTFASDAKIGTSWDQL